MQASGPGRHSLTSLYTRWSARVHYIGAEQISFLQKLIRAALGIGENSILFWLQPLIDSLFLE